MMGWCPRCYIPSFVEIGLPVPEKIFKGFLPYQSSRKRLIERIFTPKFGFVRQQLTAVDSELRQFIFC